VLVTLENVYNIMSILSRYVLYKNIWLSSVAPHLSKKLSDRDMKYLLSLGGFIVRNTYDFDCGEDTSFWFVIKDKYSGMSELTSRTRNKIKRANNTLSIKIVSKQNFMHGNPYDIIKSAFCSYKIKSDLPTKDDFIRRIDSCGSNYDFWAIYDKKNDKMVGFSINRIHDGICDYETFKVLPEYLRWYYPIYGLLYAENRYYLEVMGLKYVSDGARSITEYSNVQPFLEHMFNFRKAFCKLQVRYVWWLKVMVSIIYPFRNIVPSNSISSILRLESIRRKNY